MGILASILGNENPVAKWTLQNRNLLSNWGAGLASGNTLSDGLSRAVQMGPTGIAADEQVARDEAEKAERQEAINQSAKDLAKFPDLMQAVASKAITPAQAYDEAFRRGTPGYGQPEPLKPTASMQEYEYARSQGYEGTFQQYETDMKKAGATNIDLNANQGAAAAYADRMAAANAVLSDPALEAAQSDIVQQGLGNVPIAGNFMTSEAKKLADQAQRDFINAVLRRESGAVISPSEFENAKQQYFPQPGDTQAVKDQKRANRELAIKGVARAAGSGYQQPPALANDPLGIR